ncbi:MAG: iron-sulfur cluster assembly scaffold protein [Patescibacteria group bacterium]
MTDFYQEAMLAEFKEPQNKGKLVPADLEHEGRNASCGDEIKLYLKFATDGQTITDIKWEGRGCVVSVTSMSLLSEKIKGKTLAELKTWDKTNLLPFFGMSEVNRGREKCFLLGLNAVQQALELWEAKQ